MSGGLIIRRQRSGAVWGGLASSLVPPAGTVSGAAPVHLVVARRQTARAVWRGSPVAPVRGAPVTGGLVRRRQAARPVARWTAVTTTNLQNGTTPDHLVIARRTAARAVWRGYVSATTNLPFGEQPGGLVRRRSAARASWAGTVTRTTNAAPSQPVSGTAPDHLVVGRRTTSRAVWRGTVSATTNAQAGISGKQPPHPVIGRRSTARAVAGGIPVPPQLGKPGTGGLVKRRTGTRGQWYGRPVRTINAHGPAGSVQPRATVPVPRRYPARSGTWARQAGAQPPVFTLGLITAADVPASVLAGSTAAPGTIAATTQTTGGPS